jgi:hypothetical protein
MDWITGIATVVSMELIARRRWYGWAVGLANQSLWLFLIFDRELWGLLPLSAVLTWRYTIAMFKWRLEHENRP